MASFDAKIHQMNSTSVKALLTAKEAENATSKKLEDEQKERQRVAQEYTDRYVKLCVEKIGSDIDFDVKHGHTRGTYKIEKSCGTTRIPTHHTDIFRYQPREYTECKSLHDIVIKSQVLVQSWRKDGGLDVSIEPPKELPVVSEWNMGWMAQDNKCPNLTLSWYIK